MTTSAASAQTYEPPERSEPPFPPAVVEEMLKLLVKAVRAHQLYLHNNPIYLRAIDALRRSFLAIWAHADEIVLVVTETELRWSGVAVLTEATKSTDSLPWLFFKDGIREVAIQRGFEEEEVVGLLDIVQRSRNATPEQDDLLTMLWEKDFLNLRYRFVDLAVESTAPIDASLPSESRPAEATPAALEEAPPELARPGVVSLDDFDSTLYFLDENELLYLTDAVRAEYAADLRRNVITILFDVFEQQTDPKVREEICSIVDNLMVHLLSATQLSTVAALIREALATAERGRDIQAAHAAALRAIPDRLSAPEALAQLLQSLDEAAELPPQQELSELFEQLRPSALGVVFVWLGKLQNAALRPMLEAAAARLASGHTNELVQLIGDPDRVVSHEAIRRAGDLKTAAAVPPLLRIMTEDDAAARLVAVTALNEIGSPSALQVIERAVDDAERDVRLAALRALHARKYRPVLPRLEAAVKGKALRDANLTEKMAVFELYGTLCGDGGVPHLDEILNGKGFLGRREDPELRACAAMALGRIGTRIATDALRKATTEKEVLVRNAVSRALRSGA